MTIFTADYDEFKKERESHEVPCYQADTIIKGVLAPVLMASWLDAWGEMVENKSWPTTQPPIISKWLQDTEEQNHSELFNWVENMYTKAECVTFKPVMDAQFAPESGLFATGNQTEDGIRETAEIDTAGRRKSCISGKEAKASRVVCYKDLKEELLKPEHKAMYDLYVKSSGNSLDDSKLKMGLAQKLGKLHVKGPEYYPGGDVTQPKKRIGACYYGWQAKTEAIAEAKALSCKAHFATGYPSVDPEGKLTPEMPESRLKELTTPTAQKQ